MLFLVAWATQNLQILSAFLAQRAIVLVVYIEIAGMSAILTFTISAVYHPAASKIPLVRRKILLVRHSGMWFVTVHPRYREFLFLLSPKRHLHYSLSNLILLVVNLALPCLAAW